MIGLIISSTALGLLLSEKSKDRLIISRELLHLCDMIIIDLGFSVTPATKLLQKLLSDSSLRHLSFITEENIKKRLPVCSVLSASENEQISEFVYMLGKSDVKAQTKLVLSFKEYMKKTEEKYSEKYKKESKLYITFGFFSGVLVSLIFL